MTLRPMASVRAGWHGLIGAPAVRLRSPRRGVGEHDADLAGRKRDGCTERLGMVWRTETAARSGSHSNTKHAKLMCARYYTHEGW
jgi:hypothetical protein